MKNKIKILAISVIILCIFGGFLLPIDFPEMSDASSSLFNSMIIVIITALSWALLIIMPITTIIKSHSKSIKIISFLMFLITLAELFFVMRGEIFDDYSFIKNMLSLIYFSPFYGGLAILLGYFPLIIIPILNFILFWNWGINSQKKQE